MNACCRKILVKRFPKAIRDTFSANMWHFYPTEGESSTPIQPLQFPHLLEHSDLPMRKSLEMVGLLTVIIFFQSKKFTACKVKDEKEETITQLITQLSVTVTLLYLFEKHISYFTEVKEDHSNNIASS